MMQISHVLQGAFAALTLILVSTSVAGEKRMVAYVPNWIDLKAFSETIDYSKLTHINIAFENPFDASGELSFSSRNDFLIRKAHENHLKVLVSIGGGAASGDKALLSRYFELLTD